ncbi:MAG: C39 family peptidase [Microcoleus vaginatus WJT46-NPBG5]|jgi:hypothetical protein|nr:C39 family peptidase [Microcoleus vaginatus WJT46-NPBG5]
MTISLLNVVKYYQGAANQEKALNILQAELERTHPHLLREDSEFVKIWKTPEDLQATAAMVTPNTTVISQNSDALTAVAAAANLGNESSTAVAATVVKKPGNPSTVQLSVPYFSQLNNELNPHGSCNVTSVAMCIVYLGYQWFNSSGEQLEDQLYRYCTDNRLSRHSPTDLAKLINIYGYKDDFQPDAKWGDVKQWLAAGNPCIAHGWFTRSGHIITIVGYNEKGWIVNDPYGEWYEWGYETSISGKGLVYSYGMMKEVCGSDGDLWIHFVSK